MFFLDVRNKSLSNYAYWLRKSSQKIGSLHFADKYLTFPIKFNAEMFPATNKDAPMLALALTVNSLIVVFPDVTNEVNWAELGVTLPIGVFCIPPWACNVELKLALPVVVNPAETILPNTVKHQSSY